jgi:2-methylaconitate cis-trans-isomerase PrpF
VETIQVDIDGHFLEDGNYRISGVKGTGSSIKVSFLSPGGSMTGKTFPTGNRQDDIMVHASSLPAPFVVKATLIDVSNPFIFVDKSSLPPDFHAAGPDADISLDIIEAIRRQGAVEYGLASDVQDAGLRRGTPKIALVSRPMASPLQTTKIPNISVLAYSMGKVHPSVQLTGAVCLGAAACLKGTIVSELMTEIPEPSTQDIFELASQQNQRKKVDHSVVIGHNSGIIDVDVDVTADDEVRSVTVFRTARRLFEGTIIVPV